MLGQQLSQIRATSRIAINATYLTISNTLQYVLLFLTGVLIARFQGADALGVYGLASAVGQIAYRVASLGVPVILTRMFSRASPYATDQYRAALTLRLWMGGATA